MKVFRFDKPEKILDFDPSLLSLETQEKGRQKYVNILYDNRRLNLRLPRQNLYGIQQRNGSIFLPYHLIKRDEEEVALLNFMNVLETTIIQQLESIMDLSGMTVRKFFFNDKMRNNEMCYVKITDGICKLKSFQKQEKALTQNLQTYGEYLPLVVPKISVVSDRVYFNFFCNLLYMKPLKDMSEVDEDDLIGDDLID